MPLLFIKNPSDFHPADSHTGHIGTEVSSKSELIRAIASALSLPPHFEHNWDTILAALEDLSWLPSGKITLIHDEVPTLSIDDLSIYIHALDKASQKWLTSGPYSLDAVFPKKHRHQILSLLADVRPKSPWRRLKAELDRASSLPYSIQDEFISMKFDGFSFVMDIVEQRDGSTRQIVNALTMAFAMRSWDRDRFTKALPSLCIHDIHALRETATRILITLLSLNKQSTGEKIPYNDIHECIKLLQQALALGLQENTEIMARKVISANH
ncbi:barstar family protein [Myxococcus fulvus]|uniref:barstar family protein n=1 Tax=Myxococcus fulvus TaxID=33 RepID=UPI003B9C5824